MSAAVARRVTLLTDFGTADGYVAAMKGVIAALAPGVIIDDASHEIPAGDVSAGAWALGAYWHLYPPGTVHVAVIDPGVGSERSALAIEVDHRTIITPDNGLATYVLSAHPPARVVALEASGAGISATFHGRDVFAPAAGRAAAGVAITSLGLPHDRAPMVLDAARITDNGGRILGEVVHVDRFGNLVTCIAAPRGGVVRLAGVAVPVVRTYADVEQGRLLALTGSRGTLEIAVRGGSAARQLAAARGTLVEWVAHES